MQVHAVPEAERAFDSTGRRLPWGLEFADNDHNQRTRIPEEKGPFGKARKRGSTRAKTPTAKSAEDSAKLDNLRAIDDIFGRFKVDEDKKRSLSGHSVAALPPSASAPILTEGGGLLGTSFDGGAPTNITAKEPKEVILYGYGSDVQWAAIDFFEKVSNGIIYEEYDREPYNPKFNYAFGTQRTSHYRSLSKAALSRVNQFVGGDHWIKVTFDSAEAAERACHYSPHNIQGYTVFAEAYRGTGPQGGDRALRAQVGGAVSLLSSPQTTSSSTIPDTSTTVSSATATTAHAPSLPPRSTTMPLFPSGSFPMDDGPVDRVPPAPIALPRQTQMQSTTTSAQLAPTSRRATLRLKGANVKPAVFMPQEKAFLPAPPRWQQTFGSLPIIGWVIGSGQGIIGDQVPRKEDGSFDANTASLYWRMWYSVDSCLGTDFCGVRDAEYDD
ncbi:uncharacterized protein EKO05_0006614 [Ascochyta rabiei]|uniref:Uncharacterized protein n=1 Tax=Didymella rabiei TaxID=5454 RepID=A0A162VYP1_DIDRA|nr:uncharacterized protein EKO05_0006614 [Ascochyta rabiei]KZM18676.1 hypothetical protein ST47_g10027 [Ascochyta rabiei]UPX16200.1 hypothetical protein EKO05_0006614 [Ascochyta rabiei]